MEDCSVWSRAEKLYAQEHGHSLREVETKVSHNACSRMVRIGMLFGSLISMKHSCRFMIRHAYRPDLLAKAGKDLHQVIDAFQKATGAEIVIDSSKRVEQYRALLAAKPVDSELKLIHLVRDGRAVLHSKMERAIKSAQHGCEVRLMPAIHEWCCVNLEILNTMGLVDARDSITIRYEDLCEYRETSLRRICKKFGFAFDDAMLRLSSDQKHNVGGSQHRFAWNANTQICLDERWKHRLNAWQRLVYHVLAGSVHKRLGY